MSGHRIGPGTILGFYRLDGVLGEGGMGVVYRAFDTRLNRPVAIKFLSNEMADESARRRFQQEAQTASSLNHPHILTVHDIGEIIARRIAWSADGKHVYASVSDVDADIVLLAGLD